MTPLAIYYKAVTFFKAGGFCYSFKVPDNLNMRYFAKRIRELAKARGYNWRVAYWGEGRTWLIKQKVE